MFVEIIKNRVEKYNIGYDEKMNELLFRRFLLLKYNM